MGVIVILQLLDPSFATMTADPRGVHSRVMSPNTQLEVAGIMMTPQQALMTTMSRQQGLEGQGVIFCTACEGHFSWFQQNTAECCMGCGQIVHAHCMVEAYRGEVKLCKRCILQTDHMYELAIARECARLPRSVTDGVTGPNT